jgi:hypothetical protein
MVTITVPIRFGPSILRVTHAVPQDLIPDLRQIPWVDVDAAGDVVCEVPAQVWYARSDLDAPLGAPIGDWRLGGGFAAIDIAASTYPVNAQAAIDHVRRAVAQVQTEIDAARRRVQKVNAELREYALTIDALAPAARAGYRVEYDAARAAVACVRHVLTGFGEVHAADGELEERASPHKETLDLRDEIADALARLTLPRAITVSAIRVSRAIVGGLKQTVVPVEVRVAAPYSDLSTTFVVVAELRQICPNCKSDRHVECCMRCGRVVPVRRRQTGFCSARCEDRATAVAQGESE